MKTDDITKTGKEIHGQIAKHLDKRFISAVDFAGTGTVWLTVKSVTKHDEIKYMNGNVDHDAILIHFEETTKPLKLNSTNIKSITVLLGTGKVDDWKGKQIPLKSVKGVFFGEPGFAIRVDLNAKKPNNPVKK